MKINIENNIDIILFHIKDTTISGSVVVKMARKFIILLFCINAFGTREVVSECKLGGKRSSLLIFQSRPVFSPFDSRICSASSQHSYAYKVLDQWEQNIDSPRPMRVEKKDICCWNIFISAACVPASECRQYEADQERLGQELNYNFIYLRGKGREGTLFYDH